MPVNPVHKHTISIRRPKSELAMLRELARVLKSTPTRLISDAFDRALPGLLREAGLTPADLTPGAASAQQTTAKKH